MCFPEVLSAQLFAYWTRRRAAMRKRHARYRRGREGVRPRHRGKR